MRTANYAIVSALSALSLLCGPAMSLADNDRLGYDSLRSLAGSSVDLPRLKQVISALDEHTGDTDIALLLSGPVIDPDFVSALKQACGQEEFFVSLFADAAFEARKLNDDARSKLSACLSAVFDHADQEFGVAAPGFLKKYAPEYVSRGVDLGFECGYRTQETFAEFSFALWFYGFDELQRDFRFRCIGDIGVVERYSEESIMLGVSSMASEGRLLIQTFSDWSEVQRYLAYRDIVLRNGRVEACEWIYENYRLADPDVANLVEENSCAEVETLVLRRIRLKEEAK